MADRKGARTTDLEGSAALTTSVRPLSLFLSLNAKTPILNDGDRRIERGPEEWKVCSEGWLGVRGERGRRRGVREGEGGDEDEEEEEGGWKRARVAIL